MWFIDFYAQVRTHKLIITNLVEMIVTFSPVIVYIVIHEVYWYTASFNMLQGEILFLMKLDGIP